MNLRALLASIVLASAVFAPAAAQAAEAKVGNVAMSTPENWRADPDPQAREGRPSLRFQPATGKDFYVLVTPFQLNPSIGLDAKGVRLLVESVASTTEPNSVEKKLPVHELRSGTVQGYYFSATDPSPKPEEWKYMTQGIMLVGTQAVGFTIFTNAKGSTVPAQALEMLRSAHAQ